MHEVALAQGILDVVLDVAGGREPRTVRVRAGELQSVTQDSLQFCFEMVAQDTPAAIWAWPACLATASSSPQTK